MGTNKQITMAQQDKPLKGNSEYINPYEVTPDKPFHIAFLREIIDQYDAGEISYGKMVEMLNEVAMKWYEQKRLLIEIMEADEKDGLYEPTISKMETTQTAVEWIVKELELEGYPYIIKQAKQMERQQLANSWDKACDQYIYRDGNLVKIWKDFDEFYNETYGSNN